MTKETFNCAKFVPHTCKAYCCGNVPIKKNVYFSHFFDRQRSVIKEVDLGEEIFPQTKDSVCTFLGDDYHCLIYEDRPEQCRDFGCSDKPFMACPYMHQDGRSRTTAEQTLYKEKIEKQKGLIEHLYDDVQGESLLG